ncbi:MAG TPA: caspase family protein [Terriglobales bacterium]|nr:caspase family protein [Terriglobales bacterium]
MAKYALCIGINDYPGTGNDLSGCVNDANDWAATLQKTGFVTMKILNKQATGKNIRAALKSTIAEGIRGDMIVIQYSGHGSYVPDENGDEPDGMDECICPYDIHSKGPITDDELFEIYSAKQRGVKLVVISDSCHSGSVARFAPITTPPTVKGGKAPQLRVRFLPPGSFLPKRDLLKLGSRRGMRRSSPPGRYAALLMAGCQDAEYSYDAYFQGRPNGAFSFVALRALTKLSTNATFGQWFNAIRRALPSPQYPQTPNLFGSTRMKSWKVFV